MCWRRSKPRSPTPRASSRTSDLKISLYRLFLEIWTSSPINDHTDTSGVAPGDEASARRNLDAISLQPRIAFLLHALEGFSLGEIARALSVSEARAAALIDTASAEIAGQLATDVLIIEDEPLIALDLRGLVEELGHKVVTVARTHKEAVEAISRIPPASFWPIFNWPTAALVSRRSMKYSARYRRR